MNLRKKLTTHRFYIATLKQRVWLRQKTSSTYFARIYVVISLAFLLLTSTFWSLLGARVQQFNADQLADPLLFSSWSTFRGAQFPGSHTFLIKWPLFYLVKLCGYSRVSFMILTVLTVLLTVAALVYILYKIDKRPLIFGTLCIMLGSVLLLIPTVPKSGVLLPVNMAMLETRNIEYAVFILALSCLAKARRIKSRWFVVGVVLLGLLIASDKLFLSMTLGGALLALVIYALAHGWNVVTLAADWLVASVGAVAVAVTIYWFISVVKITTIVGGGAAGPYGVVESARTAVIGAIYALGAVFTNFGANPAFHTLELTLLPRDAVRGLISWSGPAYLLNLGIMLLCGYAISRIIKRSLLHNQNWRITLDTPSRIALMLIYSTIAAVVVFVFSNHYFAGDARYLAIALFTGFVALAAYLRGQPIHSPLLTIGGSVLIFTSLLACFGLLSTYHKDVAALKPIQARNVLISKALQHHNVDVLAGDYWRTVPTRVISDRRVNIMPLQNCTLPRNILTSSDWNRDLNSESFAYLLSLDKGLTDFPTCSLHDVVNTYGKPNSSLVIEGTLENPKELLLFYDNGSQRSSLSTGSVSNVPASVTPIPLDELPHPTCSVPTVMNIVAHQDDDLLFMNPDLYKNIQHGYCIRTVYLTAGDAGFDKFYWLKREQGAEAAYGAMLGGKQEWVTSIVKLRDNGAYATIASPRNNPKISLIFMQLPDGNIHGQGFGASNFANLERLENGMIPRVYSIDGSSYFSSNQIVTSLSELMVHFLPTEINTQSNIAGSKYVDHSDHMAAGRFASQAYNLYEKNQFENKVSIPFNYYLGYPVHEKPANVSGEDLDKKISFFLEYATYDAGVCHSVAACSANPAYGAYLPRQYKAER